MTALSIVQEACKRLSLDVPSVLFSSTNDLDIQLRGLLNAEVIDLARYGAWTRLTREKTFSTAAQEVQTSAVPADFDWYIDDTMYNRTMVRKLVGPITAEDWQKEKAGPVYSSVFNAFRFRGGNILITPDPTASQTVAYEYITKYRVADSDDNEDQEIFAADTDYALLDEELLTQGLIWRWKQKKGLDYAEDFQTYYRNCDTALARDGGKKKINLTSPAYRQAFQANVPEGDWP